MDDVGSFGVSVCFYYIHAALRLIYTHSTMKRTVRGTHNHSLVRFDRQVVNCECIRWIASNGSFPLGLRIVSSLARTINQHEPTATAIAIATAQTLAASALKRFYSILTSLSSRKLVDCRLTRSHLFLWLLPQELNSHLMRTISSFFSVIGTYEPRMRSDEAHPNGSVLHKQKERGRERKIHFGNQNLYR